MNFVLAKFTRIHAPAQSSRRTDAAAARSLIGRALPSWPPRVAVAASSVLPIIQSVFGPIQQERKAGYAA